MDLPVGSSHQYFVAGGGGVLGPKAGVGVLRGIGLGKGMGLVASISKEDVQRRALTRYTLTLGVY